MACRIVTQLVFVIPLLCLFSGVIRAQDAPGAAETMDNISPQEPPPPAAADAAPLAPYAASPAAAAPDAAAAEDAPLSLDAAVPQGIQNYQKKALEVHNDHRQHHHVAPLELRDDLNARAIKCAEYYAEHHILDHSCPENGDEGENLWSYTKIKITDIQAAEIATNAWYAEEFKHNWALDWQPASSHFTQVVWKNTSHIGFGVARSAKRVYGCALYSPHGNVKSKFKENVFEHED